jgi:TonB family protein
MNSKKFLLLSAALLGGVLSTSAFATTAAAHAQVAHAAAYEAPAVAKLVSPIGLSRRFEGATVTLCLTVDANGRPSDIKVLSQGDRAFARNVAAAVSQWEFTPAKKNGVAVPAKVMIPIELVESLGS